MIRCEAVAQLILNWPVGDKDRGNLRLRSRFSLGIVFVTISTAIPRNSLGEDSDGWE